MIIIDSKGEIIHDCTEEDYIGYFGKIAGWDDSRVRLTFFKDVLLVEE